MTAIPAPTDTGRPAPALPLDPGERVLWQGRPDAAPHLTLRQLGTLLRGLFGLALFLYLVRRLHMQVAPYWDVWVVVLTVFFLSIPLDILRAAALRRVSTYVLTDRRALVVSDIPLYGRRILSLPVGPQTPVDYRQGRRRADIWLTGAPRGRGWLGARPARVGFERLRDGPAVLALLRRLQAPGG
jgi:hypothetical protein